MGGRGWPEVGPVGVLPTLMVFTPAAPPMLKLMVSASEELFASCMAALKVHWSPGAEASESHVPLRAASPESSVELTVKVVAAERAGPASTRRASNKASVTTAQRLITPLAFLAHIFWETTLLSISCSLSLLSLCRWGGA